MIWVKIFSLFLSTCSVRMTEMKTPETSLRLLLVQMLYRHGDRAPIELYPNDPNPAYFFPNGLGQLTTLGKRQHYQLGSWLRNFYLDYYTTAPTEVKVTSADSDRCLVSAESNLAAFFAPTKEWKLYSDLNWQPIPIHYIPDKEDKYFSLDNKCPRADASKKKLSMKENKKIIAQHKDMFDYLTEKSGKNISDAYSAGYLFDTIETEKKYNLIVPDWIDPYYDTLASIASKHYSWAFNTSAIKRLHGGPLLKLMIDKMKDKINGSLPDVKFEVYSGHDVNVALILGCLNFPVTDTIPFAATLILELYSAPNDKNFVRVLYLNTTSDDKYNQTPHILYLKGCTEYCPLEKLIKGSRQYLPDDWDKECELSDN